MRVTSSSGRIGFFNELLCQATTLFAFGRFHRSDLAALNVTGKIPDCGDTNSFDG